MFWFFALAVCTIVLLSVPISLHLTFHRDVTRLTEVEVRWGGLLIEVDHFHSDESPGERGQEPRVRKARERAQGGPSLRQLKAAFLNREFLSSVAILLRRLTAWLRPRELDLEVHAGLGDPFETGRLCGLLAPVLTTLWVSGVQGVTFVPEFDRRCAELEGTAHLRFIPGVHLAILLGYLVSPPLWHALARYRRAA